MILLYHYRYIIEHLERYLIQLFVLKMEIKM